MSEPRRFDSVAPPRVIVALCIIALGVWWTLANIGLAVPVDFDKYWPVILIIIGLSKMLSSSSTSGRVLGLVFAAVGAWIMADRLFIIPFHIDDWWPIVLIVWGILLLFGRGRSVRKFAAPPPPIPMAPPPAGGGPAFSAMPGAAPTFSETPPGPATTGASAPVTGDEKVSAFAMWSGSRRRIASTAFRHAELSAIMGGVTLDLREAATATGEAVVDVFVIWGGINIRVPPDWIVSNEVVAIMGGTDDRSTGAPGARHRLIVRGFVLMGGVEIKS